MRESDLCIQREHWHCVDVKLSGQISLLNFANLTHAMSDFFPFDFLFTITGYIDTTDELDNVLFLFLCCMVFYCFELLFHEMLSQLKEF